MHSHTGRRFRKKLWGHQSTSSQPSESALSDSVSSQPEPPSPDPEELDHPPASDDGERPYRRFSVPLLTQATLLNDADSSHNNNQGRRPSLPTTGLTPEPDIQQSRISTFNSENLGVNDRFFVNPSYVRFSEDIADRNIQLSRTSEFPDPSVPSLPQSASRQGTTIFDFADNSSRKSSVNSYSLVDEYDRKFSHPQSESRNDSVSSDIYRRAGRKATAYVGHQGEYFPSEDVEYTEPQESRRQSIKLPATSPLQEKPEPPTPGIDQSSWPGSSVSNTTPGSISSIVENKAPPTSRTSDTHSPITEPNSVMPTAYGDRSFGGSGVGQPAHTLSHRTHPQDIDERALRDHADAESSRSDPSFEATLIKGILKNKPTGMTTNPQDIDEQALKEYADAETPSSEPSFETLLIDGILNLPPSSLTSSSSSEGSRHSGSPRTPQYGASSPKDYLIKDSKDPVNISSIVDLSNTVDHTVDVKHAPAVTHETVYPQTHHIREEQVTRDIHHHDIFHRILPIHDVEVLPARHFVHGADGKLVEVPESNVPIGRVDSYNSVIKSPLQPQTSLEEVPKPAQGWRRPFTARYWTGTEGEYKESVGNDGILRTDTTWVHPPTLEEGGKATGQTVPFHFIHHKPEKVADMGGLVETSDRMPGGWADGASDAPVEIPDRISSKRASKRFSIPRKPLGSED